MNVKRRNGNIFSKIGLIRGMLLGKIVSVRSVFLTNSDGSDDIAPYLSDENTRRSVKAARLEAERWRGEANRLRLRIS